MTPTRASDSERTDAAHSGVSCADEVKEDPHRRAGIGVRESDRESTTRHAQQRANA